ncbi:MAG: ADP-ribosylglycohydrolase family protein [Planctomycetota bacterium]
MIIGWMYGENDFGKSLCTAVNCGDDTDCTGATLGSILGILHGTKGIPPAWSEPIGKTIRTVAIAGFDPPRDLESLTDRTVAMTKKFLAQQRAPIALTRGPTDLRRAGELVLSDVATAKVLWELSPYRVVWAEEEVQVTLDYVSAPLIRANQARSVRVTVTNSSSQKMDIAVALKEAPREWQVMGLPESPLTLAPGAEAAFDLTFMTPTTKPEVHRMTLELRGTAVSIALPLTLIVPE